jgi:hypothetical protein
VRSAPYPTDLPTTIAAPDEVECGWIKNGDEWIAPVESAPLVVSFRALAFALLEAGLYEQVKAAALATPQGEIWWNTAQSTTVQRDHPFVIALANAIGQTPEQIDALFATAQTL